MTEKLRLAWIFLVLLFFTGCDTTARIKDSAVGAAVDFIPRTVDRKIGELAHQSDLIHLGLKNEEAAAPLRSLVHPLVAANEIQELNINFNIIEAKEPNAFAFPDGSIFFTSKLIQLAETPEELLSVAGHELAHVHLRHSMQQLVTRAALSVSVQIFFGDFGSVADLLYAGAQLANLKFSRDHERQADVTGTALLQAAQLPTKGAYDFFQRMKKYEQEHLKSDGKSKVVSLLSTHPQTDERMMWASQLPEDPPNLISDAMRKSFAELKAKYQ